MMPATRTSPYQLRSRAGQVASSPARNTTDQKEQQQISHSSADPLIRRKVDPAHETQRGTPNASRAIKKPHGGRRRSRNGLGAITKPQVPRAKTQCRDLTAPLDLSKPVRGGSPYSPLDPTKREIRLLNLQPGAGQDELICTLETIQLSRSAQYEALSYTWGDATSIRTITLDGLRHQITANLEIALRHLRSHSVVRQLWVDALCINQRDNEEKLHQVELMKSVYQTAGHVLVWLGPASDDSDLAMDFLETKKYDDHAPIPIGEFPTKALNAVFGLLYRPYWTRLWILQEVSLPSCDPVVGCGDRWLDWRTIHCGFYQVYQFLKGQDARVRQGEAVEKLYNRYVLLNYFDLQTTRTTTQSYALESDEDETARQVAIRPNNLLELLRIGHTLYATDPRDHIYGLLALTSLREAKSKLPVSLSPDYTKSTREVYIDAVKLAIQVENNLEVLEFRCHTYDAQLPSWTPDFSAKLTIRYPPIFVRKHRWLAAGERGLVHRFSEDMEQLTVKGAVIDTILATRDLRWFHLETFKCLYEVYRTATLAVGNGNNGKQPYSCLKDAVTRALVTNLCADTLEYPAPDEYKLMFEHLVRQGGPDLSFQDREEMAAMNTRPFTEAMAYCISLNDNSLHRKFFVTRKGFVGLGPTDCHMGDTVGLFYGYSRPVVTRSLEGADEYAYVGDAYVHGIMEGEALPGNGMDSNEIDFVLR